MCFSYRWNITEEIVTRKELNHISSRKQVFCSVPYNPPPTTNVKIFHFQLSPTSWITLLVFKEAWSPLVYLAVTNFWHIPSTFSSFHHHLHNKLLLILYKILIPKPPSFLGWHIIFHLIIWYFFFKESPLCQKNFLLVLSEFSISLRQPCHKWYIYRPVTDAVFACCSLAFP